MTALNLIISARSDVDDLIRQHNPDYVISVLDDGDAVPPTFENARHVKLNGNCIDPATCEDNCQKIIDLAEQFITDAKDGSSILIHCTEGVCRSTAFAYVFVCAVERNTPEADIADRLRSLAPHADPNVMVVARAEALLGREDRMIDAILEMPPCSAGATARSVILPVAA